jgi:hypothetical protein
MGTGEEAVDESLVGARVGVLDKGLDLLGGGREANQIEADAANEGSAVGLRRGFESFLAELGTDEGVDWVRGTLGDGG